MKKVIKYESENGNIFETEEKARQEDMLFKIERIIEQHEDAIIPDKRQAALSIASCALNEVLKYPGDKHRSTASNGKYQKFETLEEAKQFISDNVKGDSQSPDPKL